MVKVTTTNADMRIGGETRSGATQKEVRSPFDGELVGAVAVGGAEDMDDAIAAAFAAFEMTRRLPTHRRVSILEDVATTIEASAEHLAVTMARESGKPIRFCEGEVKRAIMTFKLAAAACLHSRGEILPADLEPRSEDYDCFVRHVPRGPVAAIAPFNFPLNLVAHKIAPAVAVGASIVVKPPPQCPITGHLLAGIVEDAGYSDGAINILHCSTGVAQRMVEDERMKVLSFTGSDAVGWRLRSLAGKKQVLLELGGNAPCIIDADADLDDALDRLMVGAWANAGQVCIKVQRILVHEDLYEEFLKRFVERTEALKCGDPLDPKTVVGPLIDETHVARVLEWIEEARAGGATVLCGGDADGNVVKPTILTDVTDDMKVACEEVFGPVTVVESFKNFDVAIMRCNHGRFGLQAGVFTGDLQKALRTAEELDYGGVLINDVPTFRVDNYPYGGTKDSGFGREGVAYAMAEMCETKTTLIRRRR
jgi:acyl-CoA reductase-like NAD-dependent aldehyde dehydrogenase